MDWTFKDKFHRSIIFSNIPISGYFRFDNIFQIKKGNVNWPSLKQPMYFNEPIVLEYNSDLYKDYKIITSGQEPDELQEKFRHIDYRKELMALLSLVGSANFYKENSYSLNNKELGEAYFKDNFTNKDLGDKLEINNKYISQRTNFVSEHVCFPSNCNQFFTNYFSLNNESVIRPEFV